VGAKWWTAEFAHLPTPSHTDNASKSDTVFHRVHTEFQGEKLLIGAPLNTNRRVLNSATASTVQLIAWPTFRAGGS
jgi:hypothetical protein